jgi:hypothetical protein
LSPFFRQVKQKGAGFTIKIVSGTGVKPKVEVRTFGNVDQEKIQKLTDASIAKIDENLRISNDILRYLLLRTEKSVEQQKFDLIQFNEVNVEEERARRRERADEANAEKEKEKAAEGAAENKEVAAEGASPEVDPKGEATLTEETKTA